MDTNALFRAKAPAIMARLMADFSLTVDDAAAILGNLGHESGGFRFLQEKHPVVAGAAGGYGWAQWTGPRRRAYEAWCARKGFAPSSDEANYSFLARELLTSEKAAIAALKAAQGLRAKVIAFEAGFERAGVKHYDGRLAWAGVALDAWRRSGGKPPPEIAAHPSAPEKPAASGGFFAGLARLLAAIFARTKS